MGGFSLGAGGTFGGKQNATLNNFVLETYGGGPRGATCSHGAQHTARTDTLVLAAPSPVSPPT